jgi:proteasome activator subunit 3 (PA28 gamma)
MNSSDSKRMENKTISEKEKKIMLNNENSCLVETYKENIKKTAEDLVLNQFPERILELQNLLNSEKFDYKDLSIAHSFIHIPIPPKHSISGEEENVDKIVANECDSNEKNCKSFLFPNGVVESNPHLLELIEILKPKTLQLIKEANSVKMGILLMIPKIEDGNNFGVEIQEEILGGVAIAQLDSQKRLDQFSLYFTQRAELIMKVAKYPHSQDYRRALLENDQNFRLILCLMAVGLRNHYIKLHDMFTKNLNKIKEPRNSDNRLTLY